MLILRLIFSSIKLKLQFINATRKKKWILSRTACLFNDTYSLMNMDDSLRYNIQKGRIDLWILYFQKKLIRPDFKIANYILRPDIVLLFLQQKYFKLPQSNKPSLFVIDSFSELVDKKFTLKSNKSKFFYAYFSDVKENILDVFDCEDLLPNKEIYETYDLFFHYFRNYTNCPIIYIFFPDKLENRLIYLERSKIIKKSILEISKKYTNFFCIDIPEEIVEHDTKDINIYHYNREVYEFLANEISRLNILNHA